MSLKPTTGESNITTTPNNHNLVPISKKYPPTQLPQRPINTTKTIPPPYKHIKTKSIERNKKNHANQIPQKIHADP